MSVARSVSAVSPVCMQRSCIIATSLQFTAIYIDIIIELAMGEKTLPNADLQVLYTIPALTH